MRASIVTLAPTDPFIGASSTERPRPASGAPAPVNRSARRPVAEEHVGERQTIQHRADEHIERQCLQQIVFEQAQEP